MSLTDIIAFFAFIVALYSAVLSTYTAINEFFRLKLSVLDVDKSCITLSKHDEYLGEYAEKIDTYYKDLYTVIIPVRIVNKSKNPTTIHEIILNDTYKLDSSSNFDTVIPTSFNREGGFIVMCSWCVLDYPLLKPLHELKPLDTFEGYLVFNNVAEFPSNLKIKVNAVQKSKTFHLHFKIPNDYRNE